MTRDATHAADNGTNGIAGSARAITAQAGGQAGAENFPVALRFLPRTYRQHLMAVYGFARSADDMGDKAPTHERMEMLDQLEADVGRLYRWSGEPGDDAPRLDVVRALHPVVRECAVPARHFLDLIQANRQDQVVTRYPTFADLLGYCRLSANPVGRIVLHVFGVSSAVRETLSDQVCTALQLAEHWQDVAEDQRAGRIYLPAEDLESHGCDEADLAAPHVSEQVRALVSFEVRRARELLDRGAPLVGTLRGFSRVAVAGYVAGGRATLAAIAANRYDVLAVTPKPSRPRLAVELVRAYVSGK